ncbi:MAG: winged helix-turn-helix transcriptional regulator [Methanomicrobiales archaeon]|nr:winged helix-turn-helix transcriptional regulator [Methanomicrobiales archaeon]
MSAYRSILNAVRDPSKSSEVARALGMSKPAILRRLKSLEEPGSTKKEGSGAHTRYRASP